MIIRNRELYKEDILIIVNSKNDFSVKVFGKEIATGIKTVETAIAIKEAYFKGYTDKEEELENVR